MVTQRINPAEGPEPACGEFIEPVEGLARPPMPR